jgi:hypothetical protein
MVPFIETAYWNHCPVIGNPILKDPLLFYRFCSGIKNDTFFLPAWISPGFLGQTKLSRFFPYKNGCPFRRMNVHGLYFFLYILLNLGDNTLYILIGFFRNVISSAHVLFLSAILQFFSLLYKIQEETGIF